MKSENENREKIVKSRKNKKRVKRQISIFTIMLWVFLVTSMITITLNSVKTKNALEVTDDNWNITLVMYDRSGSASNEAITDFTWNAVSYENKQLCMQINYACTTNKGYAPGEIEITIPGFAKDSWSEFNRNNYNYEYWQKYDITIAADKITDTTKKYDWSYNYDIENDIYIFTNNMTVEENEHFEGTIQLVYNLDTRFRIKTDLEFIAKMKEKIENAEKIIAMESNVCNFHYTSTKKTYSLEKNAVVAPKTDYTIIEDILDDYYWVRYEFIPSSRNGIIVALNEEIRDILPEGCVLYDNKLNKMEPIENNTYYRLEYGRNKYYYVGYPKSKYNEGDKITNTAELWGRYEDEENIQELSKASTTASLVSFDFDYNGKLYSIYKEKQSFKDILLNKIKENEIYSGWSLSARAFYTDSLMDVEIGDDLLYITRENGEVTKLNDNEYDFTGISMPVFYTYNKYSGYVGDALIGYDYEIQVRYKDTSEYVIYEEGKTSNKNKNIDFYRNDVVGVKVVIKDLDKTLYDGTIKVSIILKPQDCSVGYIYNFDYLQVYKKDEAGNRILDNEPELSSYNTESTKLKIAEYDIATYGTYMQRNYDNIIISGGSRNLAVGKDSTNLYNNVKEEKYEMTYNLYSGINLANNAIENGCVISLYDILPSGMNFEWVDLFVLSDFSYKNIKLKDGTMFNTLSELEKYIKENAIVDIDYNYKDSGRTKVSVTFNLDEIDWSYYLSHTISGDYSRRGSWYNRSRDESRNTI